MSKQNLRSKQLAEQATHPRRNAPSQASRLNGPVGRGMLRLHYNALVFQSKKARSLFIDPFPLKGCTDLRFV
ncbi:hypothetical protein CLOM_g12211 [Closterium sp. NIES-68]|nr:hypothetical protein CLOM_g12211 [Closterium sp. NIES-68]